MRPGPRRNVAVIASGRGWRLVLVEPDTRVLPGWRRYWPTEATARAVIEPAAAVVGRIGADNPLSLLASGVAALRKLGHSRRVLALEVREASADVRRIRRHRV